MVVFSRKREKEKERDRERKTETETVFSLSHFPLSSLSKLPLPPPNIINNNNNDDPQEAKAKFQSLQRIYAVLSDGPKRTSYDRTGSIDAAEGLAGESFDELYCYFRDKFKEVTPADLDDYELRFRGSPDERAELFELYSRFRGGMEKVFEWLVCSDPARDSHRFAAAVREGIADKELESFPAFERWCRAKVDGKAPPAEVRKRDFFFLSSGRRRKRGKGEREKEKREEQEKQKAHIVPSFSTRSIISSPPTATTIQDPLKPRPRAAEMEAAKKAKGGGGGGVSSLALQIRANNGEDRLAGIIASIEARAGGGVKAGGKKKKGGAGAGASAAPKKAAKKHKAPPPTDEEFEAAAARLEARRRANDGKA